MYIGENGILQHKKLRMQNCHFREAIRDKHGDLQVLSSKF